MEAYEKAINQRQYEGGFEIPEGTGNSLSMKGQLNGKDACEICGKKVEVELHLLSVKGATDRDTGKPVKVFDCSEPTVSATASGETCNNQ